MDATELIKKLISAKIATNDFHAANMLNVLQCYNLKTDEERFARCQLYHELKQSGENKAVARLQAIAGKPAPARLENVRYCPVCENALVVSGDITQGIFDCPVCEKILFESEADKWKGETKGKPDTLACGHDISEAAEGIGCMACADKAKYEGQESAI